MSPMWTKPPMAARMPSATPKMSSSRQLFSAVAASSSLIEAVRLRCGRRRARPESASAEFPLSRLPCGRTCMDSRAEPGWSSFEGPRRRAGFFGEPLAADPRHLQSKALGRSTLDFSHPASTATGERRNRPERERTLQSRRARTGFSPIAGEDIHDPCGAR